MKKISKAASMLGKLGKGKPKTISEEDRKRRSDQMKRLNEMRKKK